MTETLQAPAPAGKYLVDSYGDWAKREGIPIVTGAVLDLLAIETRKWARFDMDGAVCHLDGRDDFLALSVVVLKPGARSAPQHHLYEELCFVLAGSGSTEIERGDGTVRRVEWGPDSLFAVPMNARYRHHNPGAEPARLALVSDLRYLLNLYRNEHFLFATELAPPERAAADDLAGDLAALPLAAGSRRFSLASGSIGADLHELAPKTYRPARRQMQGIPLFGVAGAGYTLIDADRPDEARRIDWRRGLVIAAPGMSFNQHFNAGALPCRYLEVQFGSERYPLFRSRRAAYGDRSVYAAGSAEIGPDEEDPRIAAQFEAECRRLR
jgi:mannose-6-phosphate isomerase-like protein (cupin superfamily)